MFRLYPEPACAKDGIWDRSWSALLVDEVKIRAVRPEDHEQLGEALLGSTAALSVNGKIVWQGLARSCLLDGGFRIFTQRIEARDSFLFELAWDKHPGFFETSLDIEVELSGRPVIRVLNNALEDTHA